MIYTTLGKTGLHVSSLALGAMTFGGAGNFGADSEVSQRIIARYAHHGGNFIDTANIYGNGDSERIIGSSLKGRRDSFVLASKYSVPVDKSDPNSGGNSRKALTTALEATLSRLQTDYIDLYWVHVWDGITPIEETLRALEDVTRQGKVLYVGFSDYPAWLIARLDAVAEMSSMVRPAAIQIEYNLANREAEHEFLPMAEQLDISVLAWAPLAGGVLTGKYLKPESDGRLQTDVTGHYNRYASEKTADIARTVSDYAQEMRCSPAQLALAWIIRQSPLYIPLVGARTEEQLADILGTFELDISDDLFRKLNRAIDGRASYFQSFFRENWNNCFSSTLRNRDSRLHCALDGSIR